MKVQYCTTEVRPLVRALMSLLYGHELIILPYEVVAI